MAHDAEGTMALDCLTTKNSVSSMSTEDGGTGDAGSNLLKKKSKKKIGLRKKKNKTKLVTSKKLTDTKLQEEYSKKNQTSPSEVSSTEDGSNTDKQELPLINEEHPLDGYGGGDMPIKTNENKLSLKQLDHTINDKALTTIAEDRPVSMFDIVNIKPRQPEQNISNFLNTNSDSSFLSNNSVPAEIEEAENKAYNLRNIINATKEKLQAYLKRENLTDTEHITIEEYQQDIDKKLNELQETTDRIRILVGLSSPDSFNDPKNNSTLSIESANQNLVPPFQPMITTLNIDDMFKDEDSDERKHHSVTEYQSSECEVNRRLETLPEEEVPNEEVLRGEEVLNAVVIHQEKLRNENSLLEEIRNEDAPEWIAVNSAFSRTQECECNMSGVQNFLNGDDAIPKVIICGSRDDVARIIVCDQSTPLKIEQTERNNVPEFVTSLTDRLCKNFTLQEKLIVENAELEGSRYHLQQELSEKDNTVEELQCKVSSLEAELKLISMENSVLKEKVTSLNSQQPEMKCSCLSISKDSSITSAGSSQLESQIDKMESDLRIIQLELEQVLQERKLLERQKLSMKDNAGNLLQVTPEDELRNLQDLYYQTQEDYGRNISALKSLQNETHVLKESLEQALAAHTIAQTEASELEETLKNLLLKTDEVPLFKEKCSELDQRLSKTKMAYVKVQGEIEELRSEVKENTEEIEEYCRKYLKAKQDAEDLRRKIDITETDSRRIRDQLNIQVIYIQSQFQGQLQALSTLPDTLKATQLKVQEAQQTRCMAELRCRELIHEMHEINEQVKQYLRDIDKNQRNSQQILEDQKEVQKKIKDYEKKNEELATEVVSLRNNVQQLQETNDQNEINYKERINEIMQASKKLQTDSEDYAHQLARSKDRNEMNRITLQNKISDLENALAQARASVKAAEKEREEVKMNLENHLNWMTEKSEEAQLIICRLETQMNSIQNPQSTFSAIHLENMLLSPTPVNSSELRVTSAPVV